MPEFGYSMQLPEKDAAKFARAQLHGVDASYKNLGAVCANIMGKTSEKAEELLGKASKGEFPIHFAKHAKKMGHRGEIGGKRGRYPRKSAKLVLQVLRNAVANANTKGLLGDLEVVHASANKQDIYPRIAPRGRWRRNNYVTAKIEIVLKEIAEAKPEVKERKKKVLEAKIAEKRQAKEEAKKAEEAEMKEMEEHVHDGEAKAEEKTPEQASEDKKSEKAIERSSMKQEKQLEKAIERSEMAQD